MRIQPVQPVYKATNHLRKEEQPVLKKKKKNREQKFVTVLEESQSRFDKRI
jgi:hypothetical protein